MLPGISVEALRKWWKQMISPPFDCIEISDITLSIQNSLLKSHVAGAFT